MTYIRLCNYEVLNFDVSPAIYTAKGVVKISSAGLLNVLKGYEGRANSSVCLETLSSSLRAEDLIVDQALRFLEEMEVIETSPSTPYIKCGVVASHWPVPPSVKKALCAEAGMKIRFVSVDKLASHVSDEPAYYVILAKNLNVKRLKEIYYSVCSKNPDSVVSLGYTIQNQFHLSEPFMFKVGNPCAFCTLDRLIYNETIRPGGNPWTKIIEFCNRKNIDPPKARLDILSKIKILSTVVRAMRPFMEPQTARITQDNVLQSISLDLTSGTVKTSSSVHWPMCMCRELTQ